MSSSLDVARAVSLHPDGPSPVTERIARSTSEVNGWGVEIDPTVEWAARWGGVIAAEPSLRAVCESLAATAFLEVSASRILEPHVDALRILREAQAHGFSADLDRVGATDAATWGVYAAEGPGAHLRAEEAHGGWRLRGRKPWCSLAARVSHALVTAWIDDDRRGLFAVSLRGDDVHAHEGPWFSRGLPDVVSAPVDFSGAPAVMIGGADWYLQRPGFARGGIGVAACWWGGALPLLGALRAAAETERSDQLSLVHLGRADAALYAAGCTLSAVARMVEDGESAASVPAGRARAIVADAAETALDEADHALGPLPLVADAAHARRTADLRLYLRQHHGQRDAARLGRHLIRSVAPW